MHTLTWAQFSALFATPGNESAQAVREAFIQQHNEHEADSMTASAEAYAVAVVVRHGYLLDFKEGTFSVIDWLQERLGNAFTTDFDYDNETAKVRFGDSEVLLSHHQMWTDEFEHDLVQLEQLMGERYYFINLCMGDGCSDTLEMLLAPADYWRRAEKVHGQARVAACFMRCVGDASSAALSTRPSVGIGEAPIANRFSHDQADEWNRRDRRDRLIDGILRWLVVSVLTVAMLYVFWLFKSSRLPPSPPEDCEIMVEAFQLPPEQEKILKARLGQQFGCDSE